MIHALSSALRRYGWVVGLPGVAVLVGVAVPLVTPRLEANLDAEAGRVVRETARAGAEPWLRATAQGRDLAVSGEAPDAAARDMALARLAALPGLRRIDGSLGVVETAAPFLWTATRTQADRIDLTGNRPAEIGPRAFGEALAAVLPAGTHITDETRAAYGAPAEFKEAATDAVLALRALQPGARAELVDTKLSVRGEAVSTEEEAALRTALATPPTGFTLGTIEILPAQVPDFTFAILRAPGGGVGLNGYVASETARAALRAGATEIAEGAGIIDETRTARGLDARIDPAALTAFTLRLAALLQEGRVGFAKGAVTVTGVALDGQAPGEIAALLREGRPAGVEAGPVQVENRPLTPYRVQLRREADSVVLGGHLPDAATRERVLSSVRPKFFHERIIDRSRLAEGAPPGLADALEAGAEALSVMARGEVRVADRSVTLTGDSLYPEAARRLETNLPRTLPVGWQGTAAVSVPGVAVPPGEAECRARFAALEPPKPLAFATGSATVTAPLYPLLDAVAAWAKACPAGRIAVAGHTDPAGAPVLKPTLDTAVESTASVEKTAEAKAGATKPGAAKLPEAKPAETKAKPGQAKPDQTKPGQGTSGPAAKSEKPAAEAPPEPEPDLPRQRVLALTEYLLQAGLPPGRIATESAAPRAPAEGIGLALRP